MAERGDGIPVAGVVATEPVATTYIVRTEHPQIHLSWGSRMPAKPDKLKIRKRIDVWPLKVVLKADYDTATREFDYGCSVRVRCTRLRCITRFVCVKTFQFFRLSFLNSLSPPPLSLPHPLALPTQKKKTGQTAPWPLLPQHAAPKNRISQKIPSSQLLLSLSLWNMCPSWAQHPPQIH